jgi:hypothetical protein
MPQDKGKHYLTVITHDNWKAHPADVDLIEMLKVEPMNAAARGCHFNHYTPNMVFFKSRLADKIDTTRLPAIMLQKPGNPAGAVAYLAYADEIPTSGAELFADMKYFSKLAPSSAPIEQTRPWSRDGEEGEDVDADFLLSSPETWGRSTPIRDSIAGGVSMFTFVFALAAILGVLGVAAIFLKLVK